MTELQDTLAQLKEIGLTPVTPNGRSSDADDARFDPFGHFLKRVLGLQPAVTTSKALEDGKWLHIHFQHFDLEGEQAGHAISESLHAYHDEIQDRCTRAGMGVETISRLMQEASTRALVTKAWFNAAVDVPIPDYKTIMDFLCQDRWDYVSRETCYDLRLDNTPMWLTVQPDLLLLDKSTHKLYVVDLKSCAESPEIRASTCPFEFQTWHYVYTIAELLSRGVLAEVHDLPEDTTMGGMYHILIQKPPIKMNKSFDSVYRYVGHGKRQKRIGRAVHQGQDKWKVEWWADDQGPYAAVTTNIEGEDEAVSALHKLLGIKPTKEFEDEPSPILYGGRCGRWYNAEGEYKHLSVERDSPVNISFTTAELMTDPDRRSEYYDALHEVVSCSTQDPIPRNFSKNYTKIRAYGHLSPYAGFYVNPIEDWPEVMARNNFIIQ
ncbi:unnamed protein product, partial [marine sediment metagenome]